METVFFVLVAISLFITVGFLLSGVVAMLNGSDFNKKYGNLMMRGRIISQGTTVFLILLYVILFRM